MRRGELHIGGLVVFTTILRVVTTQNTHGSGKFRGTFEFNRLLDTLSTRCILKWHWPAGGPNRSNPGRGTTIATAT